MAKHLFRISSFFLFAAAALLSPVASLALEISYPVIPGVAQPTDVPTMAIYLYALSLIVGTMICTFSLVFAGISWLLSSGNPGKLASAKGQFNASFLGLTIILLSFLILKILNPNIVILEIPGLSYPVNQPLISLSKPSEITIAFYELPLGVLEERLLQKTQAITSPFNYPEIVTNDVKTIEDKSKELQELLKKCECSNLKPDCDINCSALECITAIGGEPSQLDLCPNLLTEIKPKQQEIKNWQKKLKSHQRALKIAQLNLELASGELGVARALLSGCLPSPMNTKTFLGVKDTGGIIVKYFFTDTIQTKIHPVTFYCQLDNEFVKEEWNAWQQFYKNILSQMVSGGQCNCNPASSTLPGPWPDPGPGGTNFNFNEEEGPGYCAGPIDLIGWTKHSEKKSQVASALNQLATSSKFMSWLSGSPIELYLAETCNCGWNAGGCHTAEKVFIYQDYGTGLCTLAHELGHEIATRNALYPTFLDAIKYDTENTPYGGSNVSEDFAETIAIYAKNQLLGNSTSSCSSFHPYDMDAPGHSGHKAFGEFIFGTAGGTLPPPVIPPAEEGSINCNQSATGISMPNSLNKDAYYNLVHNVWYNAPVEGNHALECYNDTISRASAKSVNPAFALAIWANESNASNYNISDQDFGVNNCSICGYDAQINQFFHLIELNPICPGMNRMESFLQNYRTGNCTDPAGQEYIKTIEFAWSAVTSCPFPDSPTDTSCY